MWQPTLTACKIPHCRAAVKEKLIREGVFFIQWISSMIAIKLREAIETYKRQTRERMTYEILAQRTGLA